MKSTVLVVEDEEKLRRVMELQLKTAGFDVEQAGNAEDAQDQVEDRERSQSVTGGQEQFQHPLRRAGSAGPPGGDDGKPQAQALKYGQTRNHYRSSLVARRSTPLPKSRNTSRFAGSWGVEEGKLPTIRGWFREWSRTSGASAYCAR